MHNRSRFANVLWDASLRPGHTALVILLMLLFLIFLLMFLAFTAQSAQGQTFKVIYSFTGGPPGSALVMDSSGNLYGTAGGGYQGIGYCWEGCGTIFQLTPSNSGWAFSLLHVFSGYDGWGPDARLTIGADGNLYGTTYFGGTGCPGGGRYTYSGCGTVFSLSHPKLVSPDLAPNWTETVIYRFQGPPDGQYPFGSPVTFDAEGNLYLTTDKGGQYGQGTVVKLTNSSGGWSESILFSFTGGEDGGVPCAGVIFDKTGNLYGTALSGGNPHCSQDGGSDGGCGVVFRLAHSPSGWTESVIYGFQNGNEGENPADSLIIDPSGNLYGTTLWGGIVHKEVLGSGGSTFMLTPIDGGWSFGVLHSFTNLTNYAYTGPGGLVMDPAGNLYGVRPGGAGAYECGDVFKLTPRIGGWTYTSLYDFTCGEDGGEPIGLTLDSHGNLYGTAWRDGLYDNGVVFEITP